MTNYCACVEESELLAALVVSRPNNKEHFAIQFIVHRSPRHFSLPPTNKLPHFHSFFFVPLFSSAAVVPFLIHLPIHFTNVAHSVLPGNIVQLVTKCFTW
jgi:hypothetical protein